MDGGNCGNANPFWFERLLDDTAYQNKLKCRWEYLRARSFHQDSIFYFIDSLAYYLDDAQQRNFQKWNILGNYVWPNYYVGNTYQDELDFFKGWIGDRLVWLDSNFPGNCYSPTNLHDIASITKKRKIIKITDILGKEVFFRKNTPLFYIYDDGSVEKRIIIE